ncbi:MAG: hypothetical protein WBL98_06930 [Pseudolabrys sp.]
MPILTANLLLTSTPLWVAAVVLLVPTTIFAMWGPVIVRRYVPLNRLRANNEVAGFKFAAVGVIYAVLLAFATLVVWERFNQADSDVANEASAAATVFRLTQGLDADHGATVRKATTDYLKQAVAKDWPAMDLRDVDRISEMRRQRLVAASGVVPGIIWTVLFTGAFVTVGFTFFFGTANLRAQAVMSGALSILIFLGLLTIVAIDHPFAGTVKVGPEALIAVINDFGENALR